MDLEAKKLSFIQEILAINNEKIIDKLEMILKKEQRLDPNLKEKLTSRALKSNKNIKEGKVFTREEAEEKIKARMGS